MSKPTCALLIIFTIILSIAACTDTVKLRQQQYISMGRLVYEKQCINCHQADGKGLGTLYPELGGSAKINEHPNEAICLIKYGSSETDSGVKMKMPAFKHLKDDEIAKVMSYISNSWGNSRGNYSDEMINDELEKCATSK